MASRISTYTLRIMRNDDFHEGMNPQKWDQENQTAHDAASSVLGKVEDLVNTELPLDFYCKVDDA